MAGTTDNIAGLAEAYAAIDRLIAGLAPGEAFDQGIEAGAQQGVDYAALTVPRRSGALSRAQTVLHIGNTTTIGIDPSVTNPTGQRPEIYGPIVADRVIDFYRQVVDEHGDQIVKYAFDAFVQAISR